MESLLLIEYQYLLYDSIRKAHPENIPNCKKDCPTGTGAGREKNKRRRSDGRTANLAGWFGTVNLVGKNNQDKVKETCTHKTMAASTTTTTTTTDVLLSAPATGTKAK